MERLRGHTLSELLRKGPLDDADLAAMVEQIGGVLELARASGIVHRDIKPQNLFRTDDGVWKVLDFGIAVLADSSGTLTRGAAIGTPAYMAPEQAKGESVDHRADVYGLAAVIYRCITGRAPFSGQDTPSLLFKVVHQTPLRPSAIAPATRAKGAALAYDLALLVGLAKVRDERLESASALVAAFDAASAGNLPDDLCRRARSISRHQPWAEPTSDDAEVMSRSRSGAA
jgi:serine/threonine-protein kinase